MSFFPTVYFVFPYRGVGGVSVLFYRVAKYLAENNMAVPILVDFEDGAMVNLARSSKVKLSVIYYPEEGELKIPENTYAVFQSMTPWSIFPNIKFHSDTQLLFWNCHPNNLVLFIPFFRIITYRFKALSRFVGLTLLRSWNNSLLSFIETIHKKHGLVFMDEENLRNTKEYNRVMLEGAPFLPIPVDTLEPNIESEFRSENENIRFTWVGRLVDFKFYPLKRLLMTMNTYATSRSIIFNCSIIGSGPFLEELKKLSDSLESVKVNFFCDLKLSDMRNFLLSNTDILAAMGTSALEGAALGKATILLDLAYKDIPENYRYKWLYETTGYNLAEEVRREHFASSSDSFSSLIASYNKDPYKVSSLCFYYVTENHSLARVSQMLLEFIRESKLKAKDIELFRNRKSKTIGGKVYSCYRKARDNY